MYHIIFYHSSVDVHLSCLCVLVIVNSADVSIGVHMSFWIKIYSVYMPSSRITRSHGSSSFSFKQLPQWLYQFIPPTNNIRGGNINIPFSPHPLQHLLFIDLLIWPFWLWLVGGIPHCSFDLHSLIISDVEHLSMCLLTICISSFEKSLFRSSAHFLIGIFYIALCELFVYKICQKKFPLVFK